MKQQILITFHLRRGGRRRTLLDVPILKPHARYYVHFSKLAVNAVQVIILKKCSMTDISHTESHPLTSKHRNTIMYEYSNALPNRNCLTTDFKMQGWPI